MATSTVAFSETPPKNPSLGYDRVAPVYEKRDMLPVPTHGKALAVAGATGHMGTVTPQKIQKWRTEYGYCNTAIRFSDTMLGIDVDDPAQLKILTDKLGVLPNTYSSTSRGAAAERRTYIFTVPGGSHFRDKAPIDGIAATDLKVDIISQANRYLVVAPSVHPETGDEYAWYDPEGEECTPPNSSDFAELPSAWVNHLRKPIYEVVRTSGSPFSGDLKIKEWLGNEEPGAWAVELTDRIRATSHIGHGGLAEFIPEIIDLRELNEPGLQHAHGALWDRFVSTADRSKRENSDAGLAKEYEDYWRWFLGDEWVPSEVGPSLREWAAGIVAQRAKREAGKEEFWDSRDVLKHVRTTARQRIISPFFLLGSLIERACLEVPYEVMYESFRGKRPINMLMGVVATTGGNKSLTQSTLDDAFEMTSDAWRIPPVQPGSGEGIIDAYRYTARDENKKLTTYWTDPKNHAQLFAFDEVGALSAHSGRARSGSIMMEVIKSAESGESLSRVLAAGGGTELPKHQYRFCLYVNVQPARAGELFSEDAVAGGLPGRFLRMSATNPRAKIDFLDTPVTKFKVASPSWAGVGSIRALDVMNEAHRESAFASSEGELEPMESHSSILRAKVAIALMVLDGRTELREDDWALAGIVMDHSKETRDHIVSELKSAAARENYRQGKSQGLRNAISTDVEERKIKKVADRIRAFRATGASDEGKNGVKQKLRSDQRKFWVQALELIAEEDAKSA